MESDDDVTVFGPYELLAPLGHGGMGEVRRARDTRRDRIVALKLLAARWSGEPEFRARFQQEARTTAALTSAHVIPIHDHGEIDGQLYIDMRLITGGDLAALIATHPEGLDAGRAVNLTGQIGGALEAAHKVGLIHRDVKPSNILLEPDGPNDHAYLVDFGIAKLADDTAGGLTATGRTLGTPAYMAPELFTGATEASPASDVYALGCVLFELLTGRRPYRAPSVTALIGQHLYEPAPLPSSTRHDLAAFDPVVGRALAKNPAERHAGPDALVRAAREACVAPVPIGTQERLRPRRLALIATIVVAVLLVLGVGAALVDRVGTRTTADGVAAGTAPPAAPVAGDPRRVSTGLGDASGLALSADGRRAYVVDQGHDRLAALDLTTGATVAAAPIGPGPNSVALTPNGRRIYVTDGGQSDAQPASAVSVIDTDTLQVLDTVAVGLRPLGVVASSDGRRVYVTNSGTVTAPGTTVSAIDPATDRVVATIPTGPRPAYPAISADGTRLLVPNYGDPHRGGNTVTVIDTGVDRVVETISARGVGPIAVTTTVGDTRAVLLRTGTATSRGSVALLDPATGSVDDFSYDPLVNAPFAAALDPGTATLAVANAGQDSSPDDTVSILDTTTRTVRTTLKLIGRPSALKFGPGGTDLWITTRRPGGLWHVSLS